MTDTRPGSSGQQEPGAWGPSRSLTPQPGHRPLGESFSARSGLDVWSPLLLTVARMDSLCLSLRLLHHLYLLPLSPHVSLCISFPPSLRLFIFVFKMFCAGGGLQDPSSPTKDRTHAACIGHGQSYPPDLRGGPCPSLSSRLSVFVYLCLNFCVYILLYLSF